MQGKRHSRGNVAVAALLFVTFVGVAAVALDSVRPVNTQSQMTAGVLAVDAGGNTGGDAKSGSAQVKKECAVGLDYVVRFQKGKTDPIIEPTKDGKNAETAAKANRCPSPSTPDKTVLANDGSNRVCSQAWVTDKMCRVYVCIPKEVTVKNATEECQLMKDSSLDSSKLKDDFAKRVAANIDAAPLERAKEIASETKQYDRQISDTILGTGGDRFKEINAEYELQKQNYDRAKAENDAALNELKKCSGIGSTGPFSISCSLPSGTCSSQMTAACDAEKNLAKQKELYEKLAKQAEPLRELQKGLTPAGKCGSAVCADAQTDPNDKRFQVPPAKSAAECSANPYQPGCSGSTFTKAPPDQKDPGGNPPPGGAQNPSNSSGGGMGDIMKTLGQFAPLIGQLLGQALQGQNAPTCTLKASPTNITRPGQPVTISWTSQNAQQAYLSASGQVGPTGQMTVNPQQTTSYTMQVTGYPQQQAQQQQQQQPQGQFVYNPYTGQYQFVQAQQQQQQQPQGQGAPQQGQCQVQVTVGPGSGGGDDGGGGSGSGDKPKAQVSCQPKIADVGMSVSISYACQNATASKGEGFSTGDKLSGSASAEVTSPEKGSTTVTYGLTCTKDGATDSAQCTVNVNKPSIVLVANPKDIKKGEKTTIGWVSGAMESCVVSSPDLTEFTEANKSNTSTSGSAKTPPLEKDTKFVLTCTTKAGGTKTAETTVQVKD